MSVHTARSLLAPRSFITLLVCALSIGCQRGTTVPVEPARLVPQVSPLTPRRVTFSPTEQNRVLVIETTGLVGLWDVADIAKPELTTPFLAAAIEAVFAPDGKTVLTVGDDGRVRSWSLDGRLNWTTATGHTGPARTVAANADTVVSGGEDGALRFWRLADGSALGEAVPAAEGPVMSVAMSAQGVAASVAADDALRLWERQGAAGASQWQGRVLFQGPRKRPLGSFLAELRLDVHSGFDRSIAFSPKGDLVAAAVYDGAVRIYALDGTARALVPAAHTRRNVRGIAFSPKGDLVASAGWDSTVRLWNLDGSPHGDPVQAHLDAAFSVSFSAQGDRLATAGLDNRVRFWTLAGLSAGELPEGRKDRVTAVAMAPQAPLVAVAEDAGTIRLWNLDGTPRSMPIAAHKGTISALAFSPRGDQIASGGVDRAFHVWNLDGSSRGYFPQHGDQVAAVAFSPNGELVLSGADGLRGWRANKLAFSLPGAGWDWTSAIAFNKNGDTIFTGSRLGRLQILSADGKARTEPVKIAKEYIYSVAISPDSQVFATVGGGEDVVRLWNPDLTPRGTPLAGHFGVVRTVAFSPNSSVLASGGDDGTVRLWKLPSGDAEVLLVGTPVSQIGFWNELMWVRADGESIFFYDRTRKLVATTMLRRDAILTFTPDGWYAGPQRAERILRGFHLSGARLTDQEISARSSPEKVREALKGLGSPQP